MRGIILVGVVALFAMCITINIQAPQENPPKTIQEEKQVIQEKRVVAKVENPPAPEQPEEKPEIVLNTFTTYYDSLPLALRKSLLASGDSQDLSVEIENAGDIPAKVRVTGEFPGYSSKAVVTEIINPGEKKVVNLTIPLSENIYSIKSKTKISLHWTIEYEKAGRWITHDEQTKWIDVYPVDTMIWTMEDSSGKVTELHPFIATFVNPKDPAVLELLSVAKEYAVDQYGPYSMFGLYRQLPGYQCRVCQTEEDYKEYADLQVRAICNALKYHYGMSYVNVPKAFGVKENVQHILPPSESLRLRMGNCIDGTVLIASALEALDMKPWIVIVPGHALIAWCIDEECSQISALETTMIGSASCLDAEITGEEELREYFQDPSLNFTDDEFQNGVIIPVPEMREIGILPAR